MAKKYRLDQVDLTTNGSGLVRFDCWALDEAGEIIGGRHKDIMVPEQIVGAAMALSGAARVTAMKEALVEYAGPGWDNDGLDEQIADLADQAAANVESSDAADVVNDWLTLPLEFRL